MSGWVKVSGPFVWLQGKLWLAISEDDCGLAVLYIAQHIMILLL